MVEAVEEIHLMVHHPEKDLVNYVDQPSVMPSLMHSKKIVDLLDPDLEKVAVNLVVIWSQDHLANLLVLVAEVADPL